MHNWQLADIIFRLRNALCNQVYLTPDMFSVLKLQLQLFVLFSQLETNVFKTCKEKILSNELQFRSLHKEVAFFYDLRWNLQVILINMIDNM